MTVSNINVDALYMHAPVPVICLRYGKVVWSNEAAGLIFPQLVTGDLPFASQLKYATILKVSEIGDERIFHGSQPRAQFIIKKNSAYTDGAPTVYKCELVRDEINDTCNLFFTDISSGYFEREKSRRERSYLENIINSTGFFFVRVNMEGRYVYANESFLQTFGIPLSILQDKPIKDTIHPDDFSACEQAAAACMANPEKPVYVLLRKPLANGKFIATQWEFRIVQDKFGQPMEMQSTGIRIHEVNTDTADWIARRTSISTILSRISELADKMVQPEADTAQLEKWRQQFLTQKLLLESIRFDSSVMPVLPIGVESTQL